MLFFVLAACAHHSVQWAIDPPSLLSPKVSEVAIVVADARCQPMADELARAVVRSGIRVAPEAETRLLVNLCSVDIRRDDQGATLSGGTGGTPMNPVRMLRGSATVTVTIETLQSPDGMIEGRGSRVRNVTDDGAGLLVYRARLQQAVIDDVVGSLMLQLRPEAIEIRRRWYSSASPGSWMELLNQAVEAERAGDCAVARRHAEAALRMTARSAPRRYLEQLQEDCRRD